MKVSSFIPLVLSSTALAARRHNILDARQVQIKRDLLDVCVALDLDVSLLDILPGGKPLIAGHIDLCLCLSLLPDFCESHPVAKNVANYLGATGAQDYFSKLINDQPNKKHCQYPEHAHPICDIKEPCHYSCKDGYTPDHDDKPTKCECKPPYSECNGQCGSFPHGCGSQGYSHKKRAPSCSSGKTLCGVAGGSRGRGYDCVNVKRDLESCGGCMAKNPFGVPVPAGKDCSTIAHVDDVECDQGRCKVKSCLDGFVVSSTKDACVQNALHEQSRRGEAGDLLTALAFVGILAEVPDLVSLEAVLAAFVIVGRDLKDSPAVDNMIGYLLEHGYILHATTLLEVKVLLGLVL